MKPEQYKDTSLGNKGGMNKPLDKDKDKATNTGFGKKEEDVKKPWDTNKTIADNKTGKTTGGTGGDLGKTGQKNKQGQILIIISTFYFKNPTSGVVGFFFLFLIVFIFILIF